MYLPTASLIEVPADTQTLKSLHIPTNVSPRSAQSTYSGIPSKLVPEYAYGNVKVIGYRCSGLSENWSFFSGATKKKEATAENWIESQAASIFFFFPWLLWTVVLIENFGG